MVLYLIPYRYGSWLRHQSTRSQQQCLEERRAILPHLSVLEGQVRGSTRGVGLDILGQLLVQIVDHPRHMTERHVKLFIPVRKAFS